MPTLIFYDGDGGGLGAHLKHLAQVFYISQATGIEIISVHPSIDACFDHPYQKIKLPSSNGICLENSIMISDLFPSDVEVITLLDLRHVFASIPTKIKWILSGKHTGINWWPKLERWSYISGVSLMSTLISTLKYRKELNYMKYLEEISMSYPFGAIQMRTFYDSPSGRNRFLNTQAQQYELIKESLVSCIQATNITNILIASDDVGFAQNLANWLKSFDHNLLKKCYFVIDSHQVVHSSTASTLGNSVLINTNDHASALSKIYHQYNSMPNNFSHTRNALVLALALAQSSFYIGSSTSISSLVVSMLPKGNKYVLIPPTDEHLSINAGRFGATL